MSKASYKIKKAVSELNLPHMQDVGLPTSQVRMPIGQVVSVAGARILVMINLTDEDASEHMPRLGSMICVESRDADLVTQVAGLSSPTPGLSEEDSNVLIAELELIGEIQTDDEGIVHFRRGVTTFPSLGDVAATMTELDIGTVYGLSDVSLLPIGLVSDVDGVPAQLNPVAFLKGSYALFGANGAGKTCATAVLIRAMVKSRSQVRMVLFDAHGEYATAFGRAANVVNINNNILAFWMLSFRELLAVFTAIGGELSHTEEDILATAICAAKKRHLGGVNNSDLRIKAVDAARMNVDDPVPYRMADVLSFIEKNAHDGNNPASAVCLVLKARIEAVNKSRQVQNLFAQVTKRDDLSEILSNIFRIPLDGKPITILQFGDMEPEMRQVVVSVISRYAKLLAESRRGQIPIHLFLEEAHDYLPSGPNSEVISSRALDAILREGGKLGVNLGLITSQLHALSANALEHCHTMFAMRTTNRKDQEQLLEVMPESASGLLANLSVIDTAECVAIGSGVPVPMRLSFTKLPAAMVPCEVSCVDPTNSENSLPPVTELTKPYLDNLIQEWRGAD